MTSPAPLVASPAPPGGQQKTISSRVAAFLDLFHTEAGGSASKAAELAGYPDPKPEGARLARRYRVELERRRIALADAAKASEDEVLQRLATVIRNPDHKDHLKAIELGLRIFGRLSDKALVEDPQGSTVRELRLLFEGMVKGREKLPPSLTPVSPPIDVEVSG